MEKLKNFKRSFWRVPLISLIAGLLYTPCYVRIVLRFGVIEPGVIDSKISLLTSGGLIIVFLLLGGIVLLRNETRLEIFVSSSIVVVYGILLFVIQILSGSTTGPAAVVFMRLGTPLEWMNFPSSLSLYCLYNGVKTLAFQAKPLGQPHTSKFRKKKYRDTKLEVKKWKTIESQHIVRMISNIT